MEEFLVAQQWLFHALILCTLIFFSNTITCSFGVLFSLIIQVSPNYAREVAHTPTIAPHLPKFCGILNGIDPDIWDPYNDKFIPVSIV